MRRGVLDGVTTNPSIMLKEGICDLERAAREIADLVEGRPVSVQVTATEVVEMIEQARSFASWAPNIVVKIPVIDQDGQSCLEAIHRVSSEGIKVNATAILSFNQAALAAKAGATYVSIFAGRVADEGHDPAVLIGRVAQWVERWGRAKVLAGSIRGTMDLQQAAAAGAHVVTVPPAVLEKALDHKYSRETVRSFNADARHALKEMTRLRAVAGSKR